MKKLIAVPCIILCFACSSNDREDEEILQNQERLFAQPENQSGLIEINLEGEELTTFLGDQPKIPQQTRTGFSRSTNEIITLFTDFTPKLTKVNINNRELTETSRSSSHEKLIVSPDGRLFTYNFNIGLILELDYTTGSTKDTVIDLPPRDVSLHNFVFNEFTDELFATAETFLGAQGYGDPRLYKINVNTGEIRDSPIELTDVKVSISSVNDIMLSNDGRLFAQVDYSWFVQLDVNDASLIKVITDRGVFSHCTFINSTNEIVGFKGEVMYRTNVETKEIITKNLTRRYAYFMSTN